MPENKTLNEIAHLLKDIDPQIIESMERDYADYPYFKEAMEQLKKDIEQIKAEKQ
jgi:DNA polymerase elongation subunit (family B)